LTHPAFHPSKQLKAEQAGPLFLLKTGV